MTQPRSWVWRRSAALGVLAGAMAGLGYLTGWGADTDLHRRIADGLVTVIVWTVAIYVGGATADDALKDFAERKRE